MRAPRGPVRAAGSLALACLWLLPPAGAVGVQAPGVQADDPDPELLARLATQQIFEVTLDGLEMLASSDDGLRGLLERVLLSTVPTPHPNLGRNAGATTVAGRPAIVIDLMFFAEVMNVGHLGGVGALQGEEATEVIRRSVEVYDSIAASAGSTAAADFEVDRTGLEEGSILERLSTRLGLEVGLTTAAWLVLHEVAHHALGHLGPLSSSPPVSPDCVSPPSPAVSRECEREADAWAYAKLHELGYHLFYLDLFFSARSLLEDVELEHGLIRPEAESTHPSYATRRSGLRARYDRARATPARTLSFLGTVPDESGESKLAELWLPRHGEEDLQMIAGITVGSQSVNHMFEWRNGKAYVYGRSGDMLTQLVLHAPGEIYTPATLSYRDLGTGASGSMDQMWIQTSLAALRPRRLAGVPISTLMDDVLGTLMGEILSDAGMPPSTREAVIAEFRGLMSVIRLGLLRYAKGETTIEDFAEGMEAPGQAFQHRILGLIGEEWREQVERAFSTNSLHLDLMDLLLAQPSGD